MSIGEFSSFIQLREFDDQGKLLADGWIEFYESGTSTLANVYSDSTGTPMANPVQLSGSGTARMFGDRAAYKVVIKDANLVQIYEGDPVYPFGEDAGGGAGLGTVAVALTYNALRTMTKDYDCVLVCGRDAIADGGQGQFVRGTGSDSDDDGTILARAGGSRYYRAYSGDIDPRWFGVVYGIGADQMAALDNACAVGPVDIRGPVTISSDHHLAGSFRVSSGGFVSSVNPKLYVDGQLLDACAGAFGEGIEVAFGRGVAKEIRRSWFSSLDQSLCSEYSYPYYFDQDGAESGTVTIPEQYAFQPSSGSILTLTGATLTIANLVYMGASQFLKFPNPEDIVSIDLGTATARVEWFGGTPGTSFGVDNRIPVKAALFAGNVGLYGHRYRCTSAASLWSTSKPLTITGPGVLDIDNSVEATEVVIDGATITGKATVTGTVSVDIRNGATIAGLETQTSGTSADLIASVASAKAYAAFGDAVGRKSGDLTTWTSISGIGGIIKGAELHGRWILAGSSGTIWSSKNGLDWTSQVHGSGQHNKARFLNGNWVVVGDAGKIWTSVDGETWNDHSIATSANLYDVTWMAGSGYVVVGTAGTVYTSPNLITWTLRTTPDITGDLLAIATDGTTIIASGSIGGAYLLSTDGASWALQFLPVNETIYCMAANGPTVVMGGSLGNIYKTTNSGATWTKVVVTTRPILSAYAVDGDWIFGTTNGYAYHSSDLINFDAHSIGPSADVLAVVAAPSRYAMVGNGGAVVSSSNGVDWTASTVPGISSDWLNIRSFSGAFVLVGKGGKMAYTADFRAFSIIASGTTEDLYDIVFADSKFFVVGSTGYMATTSDVFTASPTWTVITAVTAETIIRAVTNGASVTIATASALYQATTPVGITASALLNFDHRGMIKVGSTWVIFGDGGQVYTSTDFVTWTKQNSGTTENLLAGVASGTTAVLVGTNGKIITSTDFVTWTTRTSGTTSTLRSIVRVTGESPLYACGSGGKIIAGSSDGSSWLTKTSGTTNDLYGIAASQMPGTLLEVVGDNGTWIKSSDGLTFSARTFVAASTASFRATNGVVAVGLSGAVYVATTPGGPAVWQNTPRIGISADFVAMAGDVVIDYYGNSYKLGATGFLMTQTGLSNSAARSVVTIGTDTYAIGQDVWKAGVGAVKWSRILVSPILAKDLEYTSGSYRVCGQLGLIATSPNGVLWTFSGNKYDESTHLNCSLAASGIDSIYPNARTMAIGEKVVVGGMGGMILSGSDPTYPRMVGGRVDVTDSTANVKLTSTAPGAVTRSVLLDISNASTISDSTVSRMTGSISGDVVRSGIVAAGTIAVPADIIISESDLSKKAIVDPTRSALFDFTGTTLKINTSHIDQDGTLVTCENGGASVLISNCRDAMNFAGPLTNGYAKVSLSACGNGIKNASAWSVDGESLDSDNWVQYGTAPVTVTASTTGWHGLPAGSTSNGTVITLGADAALGLTAKAIDTFRFTDTSNILKMLTNLGGTVTLEVQYPTGYVPDPDCRPVATIAFPAFTAWNNAVEKLMYPEISTHLDPGMTTPAGTSKQAGKVANRAMVWGGTPRVIAGITGEIQNRLSDQWMDTTQSSPTTIEYLAHVVVYAPNGGILPSGTKINVSVNSILPKHQTGFVRWFNAPSSAVDAKNEMQLQPFTLAKADIGKIELWRTYASGDHVTTDRSWLSLSNANAHDSNRWQIAYTGQYTGITKDFLIRTDKTLDLPGITASSVSVTVDLRGITAAATPLEPALTHSGFRLAGHTISGGTWSNQLAVDYTIP